MTLQRSQLARYQGEVFEGTRCEAHLHPNWRKAASTSASVAISPRRACVGERSTAARQGWPQGAPYIDLGSGTAHTLPDQGLEPSGLPNAPSLRLNDTVRKNDERELSRALQIKTVGLGSKRDVIRRMPFLGVSSLDLGRFGGPFFFAVAGCVPQKSSGMQAFGLHFRHGLTLNLQAGQFLSDRPTGRPRRAPQPRNSGETGADRNQTLFVVGRHRAWRSGGDLARLMLVETAPAPPGSTAGNPRDRWRNPG